LYDLTLFSVPRPFGGIYDTIQRNAIGSWLQMDVEIMLLHESGSNVADMARGMGVPHYEVAVNEQGTPLVSSIFETAFAHADTGLLCYINADIIVLGPLHWAAAICAERFERFLMIGQRTDLDLHGARLGFNGNWRGALCTLIQERGKLHAPCGIDYFCTSGNVWGSIPPFALGRAAWDNWLVARALRTSVPVVDATADVMITHQTHPIAPGIRQTPECKANYRLLAELGDGNAGCAQAPWVLESSQIQKREN